MGAGNVGFGWVMGDGWLGASAAAAAIGPAVARGYRKPAVVVMGRCGVFTPPEETEHGTRPGGRGPGGVPGGVGSKNRGGHVRAYRGVYPYTEGVYPYSHFLCLCVCVCVRRIINCMFYMEGI